MATGRKQGTVQKIYDLKTFGYSSVHKDLQNVSKDFEAIAKAKKLAETGLASAKTKADIAEYRRQLQEIKVAEAELRKQRQQMINDAKAEQLAYEASIRAQKRKIDSNNAEEGSVAKLRKAISELRQQVINTSATSGTLINFRGTMLTYDQAIAKLKELSFAEQDFRRQFQKDGTLVGEYTTGIVNAFKQMGLDDLVAGQITRSEQELKKLNTEFDRLQKELVETKNAAKGTEAIEKQMIENRNEVIKLDTEIHRLKNDLRGAGDVGNQITASLKNGFKDLKNSIGSMVLTFVGAQAAIGGIQKAFNTTVQLDSFDAALQAVSNTTEEYAVNQKFLTETTDRLGLELLDTSNAFKGFYAAATQAGLTADQTREIFTAATSASANLKLSQEQTNGVLLAFGQIASKGTVQAEELRGQIGERIPGAFSIAAKAIGVSQQQLNKMLEQGQVLAKDFLPKFANQLQNTFGVATNKRVEGLQANINRLKNEFTDLIKENQAGLGKFFGLLINSAGILIKLLPLLVTAFALYTAEMIRSYIATQLATKGTVLYNLALYAQRAALFVANVAMTAYYGAIALMTGGLTRATVVTTLFSNVLRAIPLGAILTIIGLIAGAVVVFAKSVTEGTKALSEMARKQMALLEINKEASQIYTKQIAAIDAWVGVIKSSTTSIDTKKKALEELTKINKEFGKVTLENKDNLLELESAYKKVTAQIIAQAKAEASAKLTAQKQQRVVNISAARQAVEIATATGGDFSATTGDTDAPPQEVLDIIKKLPSASVITNIDFSKTIAVQRKNLLKVKAELAKLEEEAKTELQDYIEFQVASDAELQKLIETQTENAKVYEVDIAKLKKEIEDLDKQINSFQGSKADLDAIVDKRKKLQKQLDDFLDKNQKKGGSRGSKLTGEQKDDFKDIDAIRDEALAKNQQNFTELRIQEEAFLTNIRDINVKAIEEKLKLLKGSSAEERKVIAELNLEKINQEKELNDKLYDIRRTAYQEQLDIAIKNAQEVADRVEEDPLSSQTDRAQAELDADRKILNAQILFNQQMDQLEKNRNTLSKKNAEDRARALRDAQKKLNQDENKLIEANIKDAQTAGEKLLSEFRNIINLKRIAILNSDKSAAQKEALLNALDLEEAIGILARQNATLKVTLEERKKQLANKQITEAEYLKFLEEYNKSLADLAAQLEKVNAKIPVVDVGSFLTSKVRSLFNFDKAKEGDSTATIAKKIELQKLFAETSQQTYALAQSAMANYFDAEKAAIDRSLAAETKRLEIEKQQRLDRASSKEEEAAIERQYAKKQEDLNRQAFEKNKKVQKEQAKINLAMQLSNLAVVAFSPGPANILTLGVAGVIMYGIQAAIALANYALTVSRINSATYEKGGYVPKTTGGKIKGPSHAKGGVKFTHEAQGDELMIINKKSAEDNKVRTITGTNKQIASTVNELGGGISFAPGGQLKKLEYGGLLGSALQPPVYTPTLLSTPATDNSDMISELRAQNALLINLAKAQSDRVDKLTVKVYSGDISKAQDKDKKIAAIGTL